MGILGFGASKAAKEFAGELAKSLRKDIPRTLIDSPVISANRVSVVLERAYAKAVEYQKLNRLGFFGRTAFINAFRWALLEEGYPETFVKVATEGLVYAMSQKKVAGSVRG